MENFQDRDLDFRAVTLFVNFKARSEEMLAENICTSIEIYHDIDKLNSLLQFSPLLFPSYKKL